MNHITDNSPINEPCIGTLIVERCSVGQFVDNHLYLIADENSSLAHKAIAVMEEFKEKMRNEDFYHEYDLKVVQSIELKNHPQIMERIEQHGDNFLMQLTTPSTEEKRFIVAKTDETELYADVALMIHESERNAQIYVKKVLKAFVMDYPDEFCELARCTVSSKKFLANYFANLADDLMHPSFCMAASIVSIKKRSDVKGGITHKQRVESYMHLPDNLKRYHKTKNPKIEAELDLVFNSIDASTWKQFFLRQSPKLQQKMNEFVNLKDMAETSTMDIEVRKVKAADKYRKNDGRYRLFMVREYETLSVHFTRKKWFHRLPHLSARQKKEWRQG